MEVQTRAFLMHVLKLGLFDTNFPVLVLFEKSTEADTSMLQRYRIFRAGNTKSECREDIPRKPGQGVTLAIISAFDRICLSFNREQSDFIPSGLFFFFCREEQQEFGPACHFSCHGMFSFPRSTSSPSLCVDPAQRLPGPPAPLGVAPRLLGSRDGAVGHGCIFRWQPMLNDCDANTQKC